MNAQKTKIKENNFLNEKKSSFSFLCKHVRRKKKRLQTNSDLKNVIT